jgi:hypothetical protein
LNAYSLESQEFLSAARAYDLWGGSDVKRVTEMFYELMRQIYLEQVWRQNEQSWTNPAGDRKEDLPRHIPGELPKRAP